MIRIMLCCGGGFSSSALATKVGKDLIENGLRDEFSIEFCPFSLAEERLKEFDIIVCCPHLRMYVSPMIEAHHPEIPIYVLPPRMYGIINVHELTQDIKDIIAIYQETKVNPVHFPGEENIMRVTRAVSYQKFSRGIHTV